MGTGCASRATFERTYRESWRMCLSFRDQEKTRCTVCAKYSLMRRMSATKAVNAAPEHAHMEHIRAVFADRSACSRLDRLSIESCRSQPGMEAQSAEDTVLTISIDGMDQAFRGGI